MSQKLAVFDIDGTIALQSKLDQSACKGIAILYLMKHLNVDYKDVLVAGNAMNDVEMLSLGVGHRILVGPSADRKNIRGYLTELDTLTEVETPTELGTYLLAL